MYNKPIMFLILIFFLYICLMWQVAVSELKYTIATERAKTVQLGCAKYTNTNMKEIIFNND